MHCWRWGQAGTPYALPAAAAAVAQVAVPELDPEAQATVRALFRTSAVRPNSQNAPFLFSFRPISDVHSAFKSVCPERACFGRS
eukprot:COSAG06_NODE_4875_length_3888_cov_11.473740_2_plen_84_part_00